MKTCRMVLAENGSRKELLAAQAGPTKMNFTLPKANPTGSARPAGWLARVAERVGVLLAVVLVGWFFFFTVRTARGFSRNEPFNYYNLLLEGFKAGHLWLNIEPNPRLMALENPYDPERNRELRLPDASYYQGKYYIYFGAAPAVTLMLPYTLVTGNQMPQGVAVLIFCLLGVGTAAGLWLAIRRRYFPASAWWMAGLGILLCGFGTHVLALARRPQLWELPIAASFAFTMLALAGIYRALHGRRPVLALGMAGFSLGLAVASRPTALFAGVMFLPPLWMFWRAKGPWRSAILATAGGMTVVLLAVLAYNQARFGTPFEFGQKYQLSGVYEGQMRHFSLSYVWHNLRLYYFWPVRFSPDWPWVAARPFPPGPEGYYGGEELYCLAWLFPFLWLAPACLLIWKRGSTEGREPLVAMVAAMAGVFLTLGGFMLFFFSATERYMVEFVPVLVLLALCGALVLERQMKERPGQRVVAVGILLAGGVTVIAGALISFDYHQRSMARTDPATWRKIVESSKRMFLPVGQRSTQPAAWTLVGPAPERLGQRTPLVAVGVGNRTNLLALECVRAGMMRIVYASAAGEERVSPEFQVATTVPCVVEIEPEPHGPWSQSEEADRAVGVLVNGALVWDTILPGICGQADEPNLCRNPTGLAGCDRVAEGWRTLPAPPPRPDGGIMRIRIMVPEPKPGVAEPLLVLGKTGAADIVSLRYEGNGEWKIIFDHWGAPLLESSLVRLLPDRVHALMISIPSCRAGAFGKSQAGEVAIEADGQLILRAGAEAYGFQPGQCVFGRNEIGATSCGINFTGWLVDTRWLQPLAGFQTSGGAATGTKSNPGNQIIQN